MQHVGSCGFGRRAAGKEDQPTVVRNYTLAQLLARTVERQQATTRRVMEEYTKREQVRRQYLQQLRDMLRAGQLASTFEAGIDELAVGGTDNQAADIADAIEASKSRFSTQAAALVRELHLRM
jgi:hypothetical protein